VVAAEDRFCQSCGQALVVPTEPSPAPVRPPIPSAASTQNKKGAPLKWIGAALLLLVALVFGSRHVKLSSADRTGSQSRSQLGQIIPLNPTPAPTGERAGPEGDDGVPPISPPNSMATTVTRQSDGQTTEEQSVEVTRLHPGSRLSEISPAQPAEPNIPSGINPSSLIGKWKGGRHTTQYFADGTLIVDPDITPQPIRESVATWRIDGDKLITVQAGQTLTDTIVELNDSELVISNQHGTFRLKRVE